eukprot:gene11004-12834_t
MNVISWLIFLYLFTQCLGFRSLWSGVRFRSFSALQAASIKSPVLVPSQVANSVANFLEYSTNEHQRKSIQCNIIAVGEIDGQRYGVGYPVNMPVSLTYFDKNELKPVLPAHRDYDHLLDHVSLQLEDSDLHLYKTPVVLTLEGEFDDEEFNQVDPFQLYQTLQSNKRRSQSTRQRSSSPKSINNESMDDEVHETEEKEEEAEEVSLEELMHSENISGLEEAYDATDFEPEENQSDEKESDFREAVEREEWDDEYMNDEENVITRIEPVPPTELPYLPDAPEDPNTSFSYRTTADSLAGDIISINRPPPVFPEITEEDLVSEEDTKSLNRAHRRADKIMEYAEDVKLMGSFHFKKKNYHLVRLLEPIFLIGKLVEDGKGGDSYALLDQEETETLLLERGKVTPEIELDKEGVAVESSQGGDSLANKTSRFDSGEVSANAKSSPSSGYNKWQSKDSDRYRSDGNKHFARHSNHDKCRTQGGNVVRSGGGGQNAATRDRNNQSGGGTDKSRTKGSKNSHQSDVDEDQYER